MVFPVLMYWCESWTVKKAECRRIDAFDLWCWKRLLSPLDCKEIQPVYPKGDQSWVFFGRNDAKAETPVLWPPHGKSWLIWEGLRAGGEGDDRGGEGDDRGWDDWMASVTRWTWVWVNSKSWWCHSSHPLSSPSPHALNLSQHQGLFKWVSSSHQVAKVLKFQLQHQSFQWTPRTDLLHNGLGGSPCSPRDSRVLSNTTVQKHQFFGAQLSL